ncbi:MAG: TetR/AcrR family transcriptional regulator [Candidatus Omnitrophica bacterium]|nr:TetR/AcrR family transcriptional regulator [Candidatus Omnitrophota bacterium]MDD5573657.1 TetR/AcrR family transcriptional regulator [Candidatus Omnitrophota bacterium]
MTHVSLLRGKILDAAQARMIRFGYRKVTMDEIARDLRVSKNTIYKVFVGKEEIAKGLVKRLQEDINRGLNDLERRNKDPLKVFSDSILLLRKTLGPWFEHFFKEIAVELPDLWKEFLRYRNEKILEIRSLVEKGIRKGTLRKISASVAVQAYLGSVKAIIAPRFLEQEHLSFDEALQAVLDIWAHGILRKER